MCRGPHTPEAVLDATAIGVKAFSPRIDLSRLPCWPAGVAFALNHFGPLCRAEGEEDQPLDLGDVQVC